MVDLSRILVDEIIVTELETDHVLQPSLPHMDPKKLLPHPHPLPDLQLAFSPALPLTQRNLERLNSLSVPTANNIQKFLADICPDEIDPNFLSPTPPPGWCPFLVTGIKPGCSLQGIEDNPGGVTDATQLPALSLPWILKSLDSSHLSPTSSFIHKALTSICPHQLHPNLTSPTPPLEWCPLQGFPFLTSNQRTLSLSEASAQVPLFLLHPGFLRPYSCKR